MMYEQREKINVLEKTVKHLKDDDISIFNLYYYSSMKISEISKVLNISEFNVKMRLHRIRKKIKKEFDCINHTEAVIEMIKVLLETKSLDSIDEIKGVGHRVVHGGEIYSDSVIITDEVIEDVKKLSKFAFETQHRIYSNFISYEKETLPHPPACYGRPDVYRRRWHNCTQRNNTRGRHYRDRHHCL